MARTGEPIRAGIIGLSWIGADEAAPGSDPSLGTATPYSHASAMAALGGVDVVAVCDVIEEAGDRFIDRWRPTWPEVRAFADVGDLLAMPLDLVSVVTPDHLHGDIILRCLDAGVPMVFSEKPFTTDLGEADLVLERIAATGATVGVNHTWRWRPEIAEARAIVRNGTIGPISQITVEAGGPRAMLFRNLSHFLDLAVHFADDDPAWTMAELEAGIGEYGLSYAGDGGSDPHGDPGASAFVGFRSGARAFVTGLKSSVADVSIQVLCRDGRISVDALGARVIEAPHPRGRTPTSISEPAIRSLRPRFTRSGMLAGLADLIEARTQRREPSSSARSARRTVALIDGILRSHAAGNARVDIAPPPDLETRSVTT